MAISYSFMDNCSYGADDINRVFSKLTTQGVSLFNYSESDNPLVSLNEAVNSLVEPGVEFINKNSLKLEYNPDTKICFISSGNGFMKDGSIVTVDEDGYDLSDTIRKMRNEDITDIYVCFYRNVIKNCIEVSISRETDFYNDEMSIKLGIIKADETVTDERSFAKSKLALATKNVYEEIKLDNFKIDYNRGQKICYFSLPVNNLMAEYAIALGHYFELNRIETTTGEELKYKTIVGVDNEIFYAAMNLINGEVQLWAYMPNSPGFIYIDEILVLI